MKEYIELYVPKENASDDFYKIIEYCFPDAAYVKPNDIIAVFENSKTLIDFESLHEGYIYYKPYPAGVANVGEVFCLISPSMLGKNPLIPDDTGSTGASTGITISRKAKELAERHHIDLGVFGSKTHITSADILGQLEKQLTVTPAVVLSDDEKEIIREMEIFKDKLKILRKKLKADFNRHVPLGTLLDDRWDLAASLGFSEKSSIYNETLVFGDVQMGKDCWIGPFSIIDGGAAPLIIGENSSIGTGVHIYTHNTIERTLSGGKARKYSAPTVIGKNCFISPNVIIGPGTTLGDGCYVTSFSYVEGKFPANSILSGSPAKLAGEVEVKNERVFFKWKK